ncbi:hypothetical protein PFICI_01691 [Pestalotiopsis fici W106-1]|uniref:Uncharacterized protein n=1 Tax=Pestalotiopsis fici (strain W106-1 / CGMCC3.15140) TaxID=1229662 RepID=W3XP77_PESFW|nr:uncharacterized protein PFICI_01691 [Pestalotiopsis fici W106-1]ETS87863.1 hypothetical protein PFICI_01691 [Pestalotiopsis fici W106-1]
MSCELSPSASAFSAVLTAFIGSIINGLTSGWLVAFMTGWISWFALFRVLLGAIYMLYRSVTNSWPPEYDAVGQADEDEEDQHPMTDVGAADQQQMFQGSLGYGGYQSYGVGPNPNTSAPAYQPPQNIQLNRPGFLSTLWPTASDVRTFRQFASKTKGQSRNPWGPLNRDVSFLGWVGWLWTGIYAPISQGIWIAANFSSSANGAVKIVKGLTVAVTALPLCIDTHVRFGDALAKKAGGIWAKYAFNLVSSLSCLLQGIFCAILLVEGAIDLSKSSTFGFPTPIFAIYPIFALIWMFGSLRILPIRDGGRRRAAQKHKALIVLDIGMGAFAGLFVAAPAFALWQSASFNERVQQSGFPNFGSHSSSSTSSGTLSLGEYLQCETEAWKKFAAVFP